MAVRIKTIEQPTIMNDSGENVLAEYLLVRWADDKDHHGTVHLRFADYASIEAEWNGGQGTTFTAIDAALDTELATYYITPDDDTSTGITSGKDGYTFTE